MIKWKPPTADKTYWEGYTGDKWYLCMPHGNNRWEVDWRYQNGEWEIYNQGFVFDSIEDAIHWCEVHHAVGA